MKLDPAQVREWKRAYEVTNEMERIESRVHDSTCLRHAASLEDFIVSRGLLPDDDEEAQYLIRWQRAREAWLARSA